MNAAIADAEGSITTLETKIAELTASISATEAELNKASEGRNEGHATFEGAEHELEGTVGTLGHDYTWIKKEMGGATDTAVGCVGRPASERVRRSMFNHLI